MTTWTTLPRITLESGKTSKWEVRISHDHERFPGCYGYFEHDVEGEGGGLWFESIGNDKWELVDFDGRSALPTSVARTLREAGYTVSTEFD